MKTIVNLIGYPGSGKTMAAGYLRTEYGFETISPSDTFRAYAAEHSLPLRGRADYLAIHTALLEDDPDAIARPVLECAAPRICLDGMRNVHNIIRIERVNPVTTIHLDCQIPEERFFRVQRDAARTGHRVPQTLEAFMAAEATDAPWMDDVIARADYTVDALCPPGTVMREIDTIVAEITAHEQQA